MLFEAEHNDGQRVIRIGHLQLSVQVIYKFKLFFIKHGYLDFPLSLSESGRDSTPVKVLSLK